MGSECNGKKIGILHVDGHITLGVTYVPYAAAPVCEGTV